MIFNPNARTKLVETLSVASPENVARVIVKALEIQIVTEEYCRSLGFEFTPEDLAQFHKENAVDIEEQLEREIGGFVGGIVSQEG